MGTLNGKVAWITGAGGGIGEASAKALADAGAYVVLSGRRIEALDRVVEQIKALGGKAEAAQLDVVEVVEDFVVQERQPVADAQAVPIDRHAKLPAGTGRRHSELGATDFLPSEEIADSLDRIVLKVEVGLEVDLHLSTPTGCVPR